jgi:hypothetical protein
MQGKLVFNQSRSTFLSLYRFSKMAFPRVFVEGADVAARSFFLYYLLVVKSVLVSPATVTGLDWFLAPSCHTTTV